MVLNFTLNESINATFNGVISTDFATGVKIIKPLVLVIVGIVIYAFFIFKFYRFLAARDILKFNWHNKYGWTESFGRKIIKLFFFMIEHIILVPVLVFFWFIIMAVLILLLSNNAPLIIMLIAMAIVGAIRITAYYNEDLSRDLAKMIPFAILGVFIIDLSFFSIQSSWQNAQQLFSMIDTLFFYLLFVIALELALRVIHLIFSVFTRPATTV